MAHNTAYRALIGATATWIGALLLACAGATQDREDTALPSFVFPEELGKVDFIWPDMPTRSGSELQQEWEAALEDPETNAQRWTDLAFHYFLEDRFDRTIKAANHAAELDEPTDALQRVQAMAYEAEEQWLPALRTWERVHQSDPNDPVPAIRLVVCLLHLDEGDEALRVLQSFTRRQPDNAIGLHLLGALQWLSDQPHMAWRSLARAGASGQAGRDTFLFLSWITLQSEEYDEATGWLRRAVLGEPREEQKRLLAMPYFEALRGSEPHELLLKELDISPDALADAVARRPAETHAPMPARVITASDDIALPDSLRVDIRLQEAETQELPVWEPETETPRLRLGADVRREQDIEVHFLEND